MARQAGDRSITGVYGGLCFYKMEGKFYVRRGSSLTGKRVRKDPKFSRTMQLAAIFGLANKITSKLYPLLPEEQRGRDVRYGLLRRARKMLAGGMDEQEVELVLMPEKDDIGRGERILKQVFDGPFTELKSRYYGQSTRQIKKESQRSRYALATLSVGSRSPAGNLVVYRFYKDRERLSTSVRAG